MLLTEKMRNKVRRWVQYYGSGNAKRKLWNTEFTGGQWDCLDNTSNDCVYSFIEKYARQGSILDLGCGSGSTGNELNAAVYNDYTGVDISDVAIGKAIQRTLENGRSGKNRYLESDIFSYVPAQQFDIVLLRDSIYYIPPPKIKPMLNRYSNHLKTGGVFIARIYGWTGKSKQFVDVIKNNFEIVEERYSDQPKAVVIAFR